MGLKRKVYLSASQDVLNLELDPSLSVKTEVLFFIVPITSKRVGCPETLILKKEIP